MGEKKETIILSPSGAQKDLQNHTIREKDPEKGNPSNFTKSLVRTRCQVSESPHALSVIVSYTIKNML